MAIHGSSRILEISGISSITGPTGFTGAIGPGGTYGRTGDRGPTGFTGFGITFAYGISTGPSGHEQQIIFELGGFQGGTYGWETWGGTTLGVTNAIGGDGDAINDDFHISNTVGINGITYGVGYGELFKTKVGITAHFRTLTFSGRDISVNAYTDYMLMIGGVTYEFGRMGITGELLFINPELGGLSAQGAPNTFWSGDQLTARILTHKELSASNNNLTEEDDNKAGLPTNTSTVVSTSNIDGTAVTFSSIFEDEFHGEGSTAIASGIHFGGDDEGTIYQFAGVTFDTKYIIADNQIGSCCYCSGDGVNQDRRGCVDYVTKTYCDAIAGNFSLDVCLSRSSDEECYSGDACCVNGICVETSETKCQSFGGFYINGLNCDEVIDVGDPSTPTGCPEPCGVKGACCINNECYDLTEVECSFFDSKWFDKPCEDEVGGMVTNCCLEANIGACCVDEVCYHCSAFVCSQLKSESGTGESTGVFWGIGSRCAGMNIALPSEYTDSAYFPYNCIDSFGEVQGELGEDGKCLANGSDPPCPGCYGWTQVMPDGGSCENGTPAEACLCPGIDCPCEPDGTDDNPPYSCFDNLSCGTIKLVSGECWECCRNQPSEDEAVEPIGSCCTDQDGDGVYDCSSLTKEDCLALYGHFSYKDCNDINCNSGACCHDDEWCEPNTTPSTCNGTWVAGDCGLPGNNPCNRYRSLGDGPIPQTPSTILPKSGSGMRRAGGVPRNISRREERKTIDRPDAKQECPNSTNIPSCIDPGIAITPVSNDQWTIDVGCGECSCCCPGVCWKGALGNGGIVNDCTELGERCYQTLDCSNNQCVSNNNESYNIDSVPNVLPLCTDTEWEANELECVPYIDVSDPDNPVWMVCSCCCTNGCLEYTEPVPCSECEDRGKDGQCVCVGGCDDCFR